MSSIKNERMRVFVVHGRSPPERVRRPVRERFGLETTAPRWGEIVDLDTMERASAHYGTAPTSSVDHEMEALKETMATLFAKYERAKSEKRIFQARRLEQDLNDLTELARSLSDAL